MAADETFPYQLPQKYNYVETMPWWLYAQQVCTGVFNFLNSQYYLVPREQAHDTDLDSTNYKNVFLMIQQQDEDVTQM